MSDLIDRARASATTLVSIAFTGLLIGLLVALLFTRATLATVKDERDKAQRALGTEQAKHAVTRQSVDTLTAEVAVCVRQANERAAAFEQAKADDARTIAEMDRRQAGDAARIALLEGIEQGRAGKDGCDVPPALIDALEGL